MTAPPPTTPPDPATPPAAGPDSGAPPAAAAPDSGASPAREVVQRGLYYEELDPGVRYVHRPGRTLTEADDVLFTTLTMNTQALHLDAAWAARQLFGRRLVNSMLTLSTLVGLSVAQLTQGTIVANLGFREVEFPHPVFHGDTLYASTVVADKRLSDSRPGQGVVTLEHRGHNQDGVLVARAVRAVLVWTREAHGAQDRRSRAPGASRDDGRDDRGGGDR